ncbi:MAG: hypothetical protein GY856_33565 [bacterium]|nr:hypothetical protein [bacterium]
MTQPRDDSNRRSRLSQRRAELSDDKRALLRSRLAGRSKPSGSVARTSLVAIDPVGSRAPFFCVHPAGGDVLCFHPLARALAPEQPFYGFQSRGLIEGQEPHTSLEGMAAHYVAEMRELEPRGPYRIGGWSLGGLVAFEMAHELRKQGEEAALLTILDTMPRIPELRSAAGGDVYEDDAWWLMAIAEYAEGLWGKDLSITYDELRELPPEEQLGCFVERLRATDIMPKGGGIGYLRRLLRVFKANARAARANEPRPYSGRITLFRAGEAMAAETAEGDPDSSDDAAAMRRAAQDPTLGWSELSSQPVAVHTLPGNHITLLAEVNARALADRLQSCLDQAP